MFVKEETNSNHITKTNGIKYTSELVIDSFNIANLDLVKIARFGDAYKHDRFELKLIKK